MALTCSPARLWGRFRFFQRRNSALCFPVSFVLRGTQIGYKTTTKYQSDIGWERYFRWQRSRVFYFSKIECSFGVARRDVIAPLSIMHAPLRRARFCSNYEFRKRNITREKIMAVAFFLKFEYEICPPWCCPLQPTTQRCCVITVQLYN